MRRSGQTVVKMLLPALLKLDRVSLAVMVLPLALWLLLWLSLGSGPNQLAPQAGVSQFLVSGVRGALPLLAGYLAVAILFIRLIRQRPQAPWRLGGLHLQVGWLFNPLVLAAVYGLVGVASSLLLSPKWPDALYWSLAFLSVPLVLWASIWGPNSLDRIRRVIALNSLLMLLAVAILFTIALAHLHLWDVISQPSLWFECKLRDTFARTFLGEVRSTGMARYAAMGGIIALGGLWRPKLRLLSGILLAASLILLLTLGSRGAYAGFIAAAALVIVLYGGKKAVAAGAVALVVLVPIVWGTGIYRPLLAECALRGIIELPAPQPVQPDSTNAPPAEPAGISMPAVLSGRAATWADGWKAFQRSPLFGFGFQGDRFLVGNHAHNALMQALLQTGLIGTLPFVAAFAAAWVLLARVLLKLSSLPVVHRHLTIQVGGILTFLSIRAIPESTGAFFGIDWLLLAPLLLYLQVVNRAGVVETSPASKIGRGLFFRLGQRANIRGNSAKHGVDIDPVPAKPSFKVLGVRIDAVQTADAITQMGRWIQERDGSHFIAVTGMHGVMEAQDDPHFKQILNAADLAVPDGISMVWLGRYRHRFPLKRRATGADIMTGFCQETGAKYRHFLYGGTPAVSETLARVLRERYGVQVVGAYVPPFRPLTPEEELEARAMVEQARPDVLWVGLSTPKQERWMFEHRATLQVPVMLGVGAAFDFLAGAKRRAPRWAGDHGLEWLYRFIAEPRRLWRRVLVQVPRFVWFVALESSGLKKFDGPR